MEELENINELSRLAEEQNAEDEESGEDDVGQEEGDVSEDSQSQNTNDDNIHGDELSLDLSNIPLEYPFSIPINDTYGRWKWIPASLRL